MKSASGRSLSIVAVFSVCIALAAAVSAETFPATADTFFVQLSAEFNKIVENPALKKDRAARIDPLFLRELKHNIVINSLVRTDARGQMTTELVRMNDPRHAKVSFKNQKWFSEIAKGAPEYYALDKDTARYYLVWSKPIRRSARSAGASFAGVVMMKIDLWDCFQKLSSSSETPFLVRLNKLSLYSQKWKNQTAYDEFPLSVPGARAVTVRIEKTEVPPPGAPASLSANAASSKPDSAQINTVLSKADADFSAQKKSAAISRAKKLGLLAAAAAFILLLVLIIGFISWFRNKMLIRSINRGI